MPKHSVPAQIATVLQARYDKAIRDKQLEPNKLGFRAVSVKNFGSEKTRRYFAADDNGQPIESLGSLVAVPSVPVATVPPDACVHHLPYTRQSLP